MKTTPDLTAFIAALRAAGLECHATDDDVMRVFVPGEGRRARSVRGCRARAVRRCATSVRACRRSRTCSRGRLERSSVEPEHAMPIHDQGYRRYGGTRAPRGRAWLIIARAGVRTLIGSARSSVCCWCRGCRSSSARCSSMPPPTCPRPPFSRPTPEMFRQFLSQQEVFLFFITVYAGAGLIANDRRANALQIYLSKPLTRAEYVCGKLAMLMPSCCSSAGCRPCCCWSCRFCFPAVSVSSSTTCSCFRRSRCSPSSRR